MSTSLNLDVERRINLSRISTFVPRDGSPRYIFVPRAGCPRDISVPRAGNLALHTVARAYIYLGVLP